MSVACNRMPQRSTRWLFPIVVTGIDVSWGWSLTTFVKPWFLQALGLDALQAIAYYDTVVAPRLWMAYVVVLAAQLVWVNLVAPRRLSAQKLRLSWWLGCAVVITSAVVVRQGLTLSAGPSRLLLGVQIGDLLLLYWLTTRLMTPKPQRDVIPGWW